MQDFKSRYDRDGYVSPITILEGDDVARIRAEFDALEAAVGRDQSQIGLVGRHRDVPFVWELSTHPRVLGALEAVIGPDIVLLSTHFFCKQPVEDPKSNDKFVAWHQDVTYWGLEPPKTITAWLAVDDADVENGCMRVCAGTHKLGLLEHGKSDRAGNLLSINQAISEDQFDASEPVDIELKAGQMSLHDGMLVHGSNPNVSTRRRCGLTLRYTTPDVAIVEQKDRKHGWLPSLVRGEDRYERIAMLPDPDFASV